MRLLIISKFFPPMESAQALQIGKVAAAIKQTGNEVFVIAGQARAHKEVAERTSGDESGAHFYVPFRSTAEKSRLARGLARIKSELSIYAPFDTWAASAAAKAREVVTRHKMDVILTSSTPLDSHLAGMRLTRDFSIPWVVSLSDPLPRSLLPRPHRRNPPVFGWLETRLVGKVLATCDGVHSPNIYGIRLMEQFFQVNLFSKAEAIPHIGVDLTTTSPELPAPSGWLAHIGELSKERVSKHLVEALKESKTRLGDRFKGLLCVGTVAEQFKKMVRELGCEGYVKYTGPLPADQLGNLYLESSALLVIEADMASSPFLPSKFADYAGSPRPILAITPPVSAIRDYLQAYGGGYPVTHDAKEIADAICGIIRKSEEGSALEERKAALSSNFTARAVGSKYSKWLSSFVKKE